MCGICGKFNTDPTQAVAPALLRDMGTLLAHRGPDDHGIHTSGPVGLAHRRLSIIDVAGGHQPMANEDESLWIVFNGEIYNHNELRHDLEAKGYRYQTHSDTETILHAYAEYGTHCVAMLRGMFAFAIWDGRDQSLFLARDHFGIKPLYYTQTDAAFLFASELKALFLDEAVDETLDPVAIYDYFTYKYIPGPRTPYQAIKKLPQAHWMRIQGGEVALERYWEPGLQGLSTWSENEQLEVLESLLHDVVDEQRMSEVPLGVFLSGGVDSTLLALLHSKMTDQPVTTFSMGFHGQKGFDESSFAQEAAEACGAQHHAFQCGPESVDDLDQILWHMEEPLADAAMLPLFSLCREAAKHVTVVHGGDGADEAFGGYTRFFWDDIAARFGHIPAPVRQRILAPFFRNLERLPGGVGNLGRRGAKFSDYAGLPPAQRYMTWFTAMPDDTKHQLLHPDLLDAVGNHRSAMVLEETFARAQSLGLDALGQRQYSELYSFIPDDLMLKADKLAMASGLEGRFPFLDPRLVNFGLSLPKRQKMGPRHLKVLLKKLLAKHMPHEFVYRKKQGFEVPVASWFRATLNVELKDLVADLRKDNDSFLSTPYLDILLTQLDAGDATAGRQAFSVYVFQRWRRIFASPRAQCRARLAETSSGG